jgi:hypothetical protein
MDKYKNRKCVSFNKENVKKSSLKSKRRDLVEDQGVKVKVIIERGGVESGVIARMVVRITVRTVAIGGAAPAVL